MSFAFYDLETTGLEPAYDQPLQFAAILTDDNFNVLERVNIRCRLSSHILPSPYALAITGVSPKSFLDPTLPSWLEFVQQIRKYIVDWAPATWVGYNTLKFDEEFLRQAFYQTLQPNIYETQFHGNDRLDIMSAVYACWTHNPTALNWNTPDPSKSPFKLDQLAPANGFENHDAHDALGDVEATIFIASLIKERAPELWAGLLSNRNKHDVKDKLESSQPLNFVARYGKTPPKAYIGCLCGFNENNGNSAGFLDLTLVDVEKFVDADDETLAKAVSASPKVIRAISINKAPNLFYAENVDPKYVEGARLVASRPDFKRRVGKALANRYPDEADEETPVEKQIYGEFYSNADKAALEVFQTSSWEKRRELILSFEDKRLKQLGRRLVVLENPESATQDEIESAKVYLRNKWNTPKSEKPKWTTFESAKADLLKATQDEIGSPDLLAEIRKYIEDMESKLA